VSVHTYRNRPCNRRRRIATLYLTWFYFIFGPRHRAATLCHRISIDIAVDLSRLNEIVLYISINSAKRKTGERAGRDGMARQTDTIGSLGVWQKGSFRRGIFLVYHRIN